jgi:hypothetical protein
LQEQFTSTVNNITFPYGLSDNKTYVKQAGLKGLALLKFKLKVFLGYRSAERRLAKTLKEKVCYYGPFKGEFGHFLAHTLPFLMYLHKKGVRIIYCGMELHKPFLVDESGKTIIEDFRPLRDFFAEVAPNSNVTVPPQDVQNEILKFDNEAKKSNLPFWNIGDDFYYWFIHRNWILEGYTHTYQLDKVYKTEEENACALFPRNKGAKSSHNNGEPWDYPDIIERISPYFDKIYLCGHPSQVHNLEITNPKVVVAVSTDNVVMLNKISNSRLIISQHSGIVYAGEYAGTDVLIIYKGGKKIQDIGSLNNTLRFKNQFPGRSTLDFAFSEEEVVYKVKNATRVQNPTR